MTEVLYVDDEFALLELTKHFLEATKEFKVHTVQSAKAALERMAEHRYDAIVADYQMPEMDGIELLETLRSRGEGIPFILFTGRGREDVVIDALNKGADFYLQKGGNPRSQFAELSNMIRQSVSARRADAALRDSEERYRQLAESAQDVIFIVDAAGRLSYINSAGSRMFGWTSEEVIGKAIETLTPHGAAFVSLSMVTDVLRSDKPMRLMEQMPAAGNGRPWFDLMLVPLSDSSGRASSVLGIARDVTEIKKNEAKVTRLNRMYAFLSRINETIVRVRNVESLFMEICRIVVESGGFKMAWVGLADYSTGDIRVVAYHGIEKGILESQVVSFRDEPSGQGPSGRAVRLGEMVVVNDIASDPGMAHWGALASKQGYRSCAVVPFFSGRRVVATLALYSDEVRYFDEGETELLHEISGDVSFALDSLDRDRTVRKVEDGFACQSFIIDGMTDAVIVSDGTDSVTGWNRAAEELFGWTAGEVVGRHSSEILRIEWTDMVEDGAKRRLNDAGQVRGHASVRTRSGVTVSVECAISAVKGSQGRARGFVTVCRPVAAGGVDGGAPDE